ncbi:NAD(P)/FAD-dependent oxidoreductase [Tianweitania sediminis]|uniref:FAD-binding oxidoreductase n=1 Tax=Tianweitania sediminis TaxID=1502156 RepID=A0A8J7UKK5_9HYPH|nr:FAD-binding oxidoreductase [Tianweitania sediminis]MBP0439965.1 FAD-binding oxidoreductase [Tianweitania sediminis]
MNQALSADFKPEPYWWEDVPRRSAAEQDLPVETDVVVVGSGYAGLSCAIELARQGRSVTVIEARSLGFGASSRSVGMIGGRLRQSLGTLSQRFGAAKARDLLTETRDAFGWFLSFVAKEAIECELRLSGRLICAWTPKDLAALRRQRDVLATFDIRADMVDEADLRASIRTPLYHGAMLLPDDGGLHPSRYHEGLISSAHARGVGLISETPVTGVERSGASFLIQTSRGGVKARQVVLATNAYTGPEFSWFRRRIIPVGSHMMATEQMAPETIDAVLPTDSLVNDTRSLAYAIRKSPDGTRILVGGRALSGNAVEARGVAVRLMKVLRQVLPGLPMVKASHGWEGNVGFTLDRIPHMGVRDGIHYVTGCNGSGIVMASYLGMRAARLVCDIDEPSSFTGNAFKALPFYSGKAWFMPVISASMGLNDKLRALIEK